LRDREEGARRDGLHPDTEGEQPARRLPAEQVCIEWAPPIRKAPLIPKMTLKSWGEPPKTSWTKNGEPARYPMIAAEPKPAVNAQPTKTPVSKQHPERSRGLGEAGGAPVTRGQRLGEEQRGDRHLKPAERRKREKDPAP